MNLVRAAMIALAVCTAAHAQDLAGLTAAQAAYDRGMELQASDPKAAQVQFQQARDGFQAAVDAGAMNGPLLYNLGNAQLQAGQTGAAIGSYLKAQRFMPGDSRLQANLAHARSLVKDRLDLGSGMLLEDVARWWHLVGQRSRLALAVSLWLVAWFVVMVLLASPSRLPAALRRMGSPTAWCCGVLGAVLLTTVVLDANAPAWRPMGVTVADQVMVRKGNGEGFAPAFAEPLSQGVEFRVLEERPGWLHIRLSNGKTGWIKSISASTA
jgi:uncharacterized membrane protein (DUF485 family)